MNSPDTQPAASVSKSGADVAGLDFADASFFYDLFWHSPEALAVANPGTGAYGPVNPAYALMHGYQPGELEGQPLDCLYPPECHEQMRQAIVCSNVTGFYEWETLHSRKDGSVFPVSMKLRAIRGAEGQVRYRIASAQDITERRRLEEQAGQTRRLLEGIAANSSAAISVKDQDGRYLLSNPLSDIGLGVPLGGALGRTDHDFFPAQYADLFRVNDLAVLHSGRPQETEECTPGPDGDRTFLCFKFPLFDDAGQSYATGLIATEITERKRAQAQLERSRQQLQAIADTMPDALYVYDLVQERTVYANREVGSLLGYDADEIQAMNREFTRTLLHPDDYERVVNNVRAFEHLAEGQIFTSEFRMRDKNGAYRWIRRCAAPFARGEDGQVTQFIATAQDITQQREQQARIEALNIRLRRAMQETHHRVKNNLQVIASLAEMQIETEEGGADTKGAQAMRRIVQHIHSLAALHELLTRNATLDESAGVISARDLLKKLLPLLQPPDGARRLRARMDDILFSSRAAAPLAMLVNEIVSNALKHGQGDVALTLTRSDNMACLEVRDQGPGFPADFDAVRAAHTGLELIDSLVRHDLHGQVAYTNAAASDMGQAGGRHSAAPSVGGCVAVTFPVAGPTLEGC